MSPAFRRVFAERGLPAAIRSDNGLPFASPNGLYNLSKLSVWWLRLGIAIAIVTNCGRLCIHRKKINISTVLAGQRLGLTEIDDGIWLVSFLRHDLGYIDLEQRTLQTIGNPFGTRLLPMCPGWTDEKW